MKQYLGDTKKQLTSSCILQHVLFLGLRKDRETVLEILTAVFDFEITDVISRF